MDLDSVADDVDTAPEIAVGTAMLVRRRKVARNALPNRATAPF